MRLITPLVLITLAVASPPLVAQDSGVAVEVAGGLTLPLGEFASGDSGASGTGVASAPGVAVRFLSRRGERIVLYLGFAQHRFDCSQAGCVDPDRYVATGLSLGTRFSLVPDGTIDPFLSVGITTQTLETRGLPAPDDGVGSTAFGAEFGAGVSIRTGSSVSLRPSATWGLANTSLPGGGDLALRYLAAQLGLELRF